MADPGKRAFHYPTARQDLKPPRWQKLLPIYRFAFLGPFLRPTHQHLLGSGFARTFDQFHTPSQSLLHPTFAFVFAPIASVEPQVLETRKLFLGVVAQELFDPLLVDELGTVNLDFEYEAFGTTSKWRFLPSIFFPPS